MSAAEPVVSVIMANFNGAAHVAAAVRSVLRQTLPSLELILSDDGSTDDSVARALDAARGDRRLTVLRADAQTGPAAARNRGLAVARGRWVAIVDNDDVLHPDRLRRLIEAAEADGADIAADDLITFYDDGDRRPHPLLAGAMTRAPQWIAPAAFLRANHLFGSGPALGYLKPVFRRSLLEQAAGYDESLRIAEDFDLVMRLLLSGARMRVYPQLTYFYRKHARSISHRLSLPAIDAMLSAHDRLAAARDAEPGLRAALNGRRRSLESARAFVAMVDALKAKRVGEAAAIGIRHPAAAWLMHVPLRDRLLRAPPAAAAPPGPPRIKLISRQRIVGATNGSSAYVLALAEELKRAGYAVDFVGASPKIFGRWPFFALKPETRVFSTYRINGGARLGPVMIAKDPRVALRAALAVFDRLLARLGLPALGGAGEYAQGAPETRADMLFVASQASRDTVAVLCDYCFVTPMAAYALAFEAPSLTIMHDLMSARVTDTARENVPQEVLALTPEAELRLLGQGDAVIAIQREEAAQVAAALPAIDVVLAPHAVTCVEAAQPGLDDTLLFVGSNTSPNVVGLQRFLERVWPLIRAERPHARLDVVGSVARGLAISAPPGVRFLGVAPDLAPYYREAGVVISPLQTGSGLKIKLIEALAAGKAVVGGSVTVQGVADLVDGAIVIADDPHEFARHAVALMGDAALRRRYGEAGLAVARRAFSPEAALAELRDYIRGRTR